MQIVLTEVGKCKGNVSVTQTLRTMAVGEVWTTSEEEIGSLVNAQQAVSVTNQSGEGHWCSRKTDNGVFVVIRES